MGREAEPPSSQPANTVDQLVAVDPYNPDILPDLEKYVNEQFEPERMSVQIVARILIKALMALPAPDFSLCLFFIPERVQMEEPFKTLIVCRTIWRPEGSVSSARRQLKAVIWLKLYLFHRFRASNAVICHSRPLINIPKGAQGRAHRGPTLNKLVEHQIVNSGWTSEKGQGRGELVFPHNEFNNPDSKKNDAESIPLDHIARIFPILG